LALCNFVRETGPVHRLARRAFASETSRHKIPGSLSVGLNFTEDLGGEVFPNSESCTKGVFVCNQSTPLPWYALGLRSNFEKTARRLLEDGGYEVFLPTYRVLRRWSDRVKQIEAPLFAGYAFCRMDITRRDPLFRASGIARVIGFGTDPMPVPEHEIQSVRAIVESRLFSQPWPFLAVGDRVMVERGPLAGAQGVLIRVNEEYKLVASITLLQRSIAVELERDWIRPVDRELPFSRSPRPKNDSPRREGADSRWGARSSSCA
jgi:transcription antitermination factor NusG